MEEVKSKGPYIYSVLESAQAFLSQHPFEELEESHSESKGRWLSCPPPLPFELRELLNKHHCAFHTLPVSAVTQEGSFLCPSKVGQGLESQLAVRKRKELEAGLTDWHVA